jgi:hypothetical protein
MPIVGAAPAIRLLALRLSSPKLPMWFTFVNQQSLSKMLKLYGQPNRSLSDQIGEVFLKFSDNRYNTPPGSIRPASPAPAAMAHPYARLPGHFPFETSR